SEPEEAEAIAESLAERYREATPEERTVMLATLPARSTFRSMKVFDDAAKEVASSIASSDDPTDRLNVGLTILTRVAEADHPLFEEASTGDRTVGSLVREALRKGTTTIATAPRGVIGLAGAGRPGAEQATANP
ncbi:MAG: hypothetical protein CMJ31_10660, partial [Phycisphaerae bacterium]|nr:hypothetical protein [Phycisphaerae bacterium]